MTMGNVQAAKDTFYQMLRDRIAAGNPARTLVVRGVLRPGVLTVENELPGPGLEAIAPAETFCLRWTELKVDTLSAGPLLTFGCEIRYATDGSDGAAGMDRGRALAAMDAELATALTTTPMHAAAISVAEAANAGAATMTPLGWNVFWGPPSFGSAVIDGEQIKRAVELEVFGYGQ